MEARHRANADAALISKRKAEDEKARAEAATALRPRPGQPRKNSVPQKKEHNSFSPAGEVDLAAHAVGQGFKVTM